MLSTKSSPLKRRRSNAVGEPSDHPIVSPSKRRRASIGGAFGALSLEDKSSGAGDVLKDHKFKTGGHCKHDHDWMCGIDMLTDGKAIEKADMRSNIRTSLWTIKGMPDVLIKAENGIDKEDFMQQMALASKINDAGISPKLHEWYYSVSDTVGVIIMERFPMSLDTYFKAQKEGKNPMSMKDWMIEQYDECLRELARTVNISCGDLKPANVVIHLIKKDLRLIDFGEEACSNVDAKNSELHLEMMRFISRLIFYFQTGEDILSTYETLPSIEAFNVMSPRTQALLIHYAKLQGLSDWTFAMKLMQLRNRKERTWSPKEEFPSQHKAEEEEEEDEEEGAEEEEGADELYT